MKKILFLMFFIILIMNISLKSNASSLNLNDKNIIDKDNGSIYEIENYLSKENTSVISELEKTIERYELLLASDLSLNDASKIQDLINTTYALKNDYIRYNNSNVANINAKSVSIYYPVVQAAIAYFNFNHYYLASELLTHARDNNDVDSLYYPIYGYEVLDSSVYSYILESNQCYGTSVFLKTGDTNDDDLYFSIKKFYYSKSESGRAVIIQDRYDFEDYYNYESVEDFLVDLIYEAQNDGVIVPFCTVIANEHDGVLTNQTKNVYLTN